MINRNNLKIIKIEMISKSSLRDGKTSSTISSDYYKKFNIQDKSRSSMGDTIRKV